MKVMLSGFETKWAIWLYQEVTVHCWHFADEEIES